MIRAFGPKFFPAVTLLALIGPVIAGLWGTLLPAFGHLPAAGHAGPSLDPFLQLFAWVGFWPSVWLSLRTGLLATVISVVIAVLILSAGAESRGFLWLRRVLSPLLSVPHAAAAFGIGFLIAPSGWVSRLVSPWATGWDKPPDIAIIQDPYGFAMVAALVAKEVPFLFLMGLAALGQTDATRSMTVSRALGYGQTTGWFKAVFPGIYRQLRLPIFAVLAYSMSVVDVAIILGPNTPPPLSVQILRWMGDPDLSKRLIGSAAALVQLGLVGFTLAAWIGVESIMGRMFHQWVLAGARRPSGGGLSQIGLALGQILAGALIAGLLVLAIWSVAGYWGYPDALPDQMSWSAWRQQAPDVGQVFGVTAAVAGASVGLAVILVVGCLQSEAVRDTTPGRWVYWLLYLPLLMPQTAFLPGLQTFLLGTGFATGIVPVVIAHLVFVLPYVFLSLSDPFRAWDARYGLIGQALGYRPTSVLFRLRLPMLLGPVLTAMAVGFAVSVGQYLPTLLIGGGRVETLTTQALALAAGGDRKVIAIWALGQTGAAFLPFLAAVMVPLWVWRHRKGMI